MEGLLDSVRHLTRELRLQMLIIDSFIPRQLVMVNLYHVTYAKNGGCLTHDTQKPYYYMTSNLEICTQKVWFGFGFHWSSSESTVVDWLKSRAKPKLLGTNFKIGSLV